AIWTVCWNHLSVHDRHRRRGLAWRRGPWRHGRDGGSRSTEGYSAAPPGALRKLRDHCIGTRDDPATSACPRRTVAHATRNHGTFLGRALRRASAARATGGRASLAGDRSRTALRAAARG